jgi:hypothetical protein
MTKEEFLREVMGEVTEETLLAMVKKESGNIKFIPPNLQTEAICLEAVKEWAHNIQYVANVTPAIRDAAIAAPRPGNGPMRGFDILSHIPDELKTEEICYKAVKKNECNLEGVPEHLQTERICLVAIRKSCYALRHVKKPTPAIYNAMADSYSSSWVAENVPEEYLTEEFFLRAMDNRFVIYVTDIPVKYLTPKVLAKLAVRRKPISCISHRRRGWRLRRSCFISISRSFLSSFTI